MKHGFGFGQFFVRFLVMLYLMEIYDIGFFDCVLLTHSNFFLHFCPELKGITGPHQFGYIRKGHVLHFILYIPTSAVIALVCTLF